MNIQDYISSGIIESYLLGQLTDKERDELEALAEKHPEIKAEIEATELALINYAAKTPRAKLKQDILKKLDLTEGKVVAMDRTKTNYAAWLAAAAVALFIGTSIYNVILNNRLESSREEMFAMMEKNDEYLKELDKQSASYAMLAQQLSIVMQPDTKKVMLKGMDVAPNALATLYWNEESNGTYIKINSLPETPVDKEYQLWAIVDGKPVDMGMLDMNTDSLPLHQMKSVAGAQAFAVTLEQKGGVTAPTLTAMYLMGNV